MRNTILSKSEQFYAALLQLYPSAYKQEFAAEMQYIFEQQQREWYQKQGITGLCQYWIKTVADATKTIVQQQVETIQQKEHMKTQQPLIKRNSVFMWIALGTGLILLIPYSAMQISGDVNWDATDFTVMAVLLSGLTSLGVLLARRVPQKYWLLVGIGSLLAIMWLWAELAVGVFTNWGS